ncbi:protein pollen defective in guidance 1 [Tanacetum coccineum]
MIQRSIASSRDQGKNEEWELSEENYYDEHGMDQDRYKKQRHDVMSVTGIVYPSGFNKLFCGSKDKSLRVWDCNSGKCDNVLNFDDECGILVIEGSWMFARMRDNTPTVKYYSDDWPTNSAKEAFKKSVYTKTQKTNEHTKDISDLNLPKTCSIKFPNGKDDLMKFQVTVKPDEGYYLKRSSRYESKEIDSVERFHIASFLVFVLAQNILEAEGPWFQNFLYNALVVYFCELMIDIIKHSFIAKFNEIKPIVYSEFLEDLCKQTLNMEPENSKKNLTFVPLAPACVVLRADFILLTSA